MNGNAGPDLLIGGDDPDLILAIDGDDTLFDGDGDGDDQLSGGAGADTIVGDHGADAIDGGLGNDLIQGDSGNDFIVAGAGADSIDAGEDDDTVLELGPDLAGDTIDGGTGEDDLIRSLTDAQAGDAGGSAHLQSLQQHIAAPALGSIDPGIVLVAPGITVPRFERVTLDGLARFGWQHSRAESWVPAVTCRKR